MDMTVECDGAGNTAALNAWLANNGGATASDVCGGVTWTNDFTALSDDCGATGSATVTFTATDDCGNSSSTTATFTIEDTTVPMITAQAMDMTVECDGAGNTAALNTWLGNNGGATATDVCGGVTWTNDFAALSDDCGATGSATVTFTATDDCGNSSTTTATFTIEDTTVPMITAQAMDMTVECDGAGNTAALNTWLGNNGGATASDVCGGVTWTNDFTALSDDCGATGSATVTFTATDDCGNSSSTTATFTIEDTSNPSIDVVAMDMTVECDGAGNTAALNAWLANNGGATASDVCGGVTWTNDFTALSDDCGMTGSATVTFTATDDCGNSSTTTATFTIEDTTLPVPVCQDITVELDANGMASITPTMIDNGSSDACSGGVSLAIDINSFVCADVGPNTVTLTVTDDCGLMNTCQSTVTVEDNLPVTITCPTDITANALPDNCNALVNWDPPATTDNCGVDMVTVSATGINIVTVSEDLAFGTFPVGTTVVTYTATDVNGNSINCTFNVTIEDNEAPELTCPSILQLELTQVSVAQMLHGHQ
jgi:hypothetical protein